MSVLARRKRKQQDRDRALYLDRMANAERILAERNRALVDFRFRAMLEQTRTLTTPRLERES